MGDYDNAHTLGCDRFLAHVDEMETDILGGFVGKIEDAKGCGLKNLRAVIIVPTPELGYEDDD